MSTGEIVYLTFVLLAFAAFMGIVGFISTTDRKPSPGATASRQKSPVEEGQQWRKAA